MQIFINRTHEVPLPLVQAILFHMSRVTCESKMFGQGMQSRDTTYLILSDCSIRIIYVPLLEGANH